MRLRYGRALRIVSFCIWSIWSFSIAFIEEPFMRRTPAASPRRPARPRVPHLLLALAAALPLAVCAATLKVGDQQLQTRGILEAAGQLKDVPYQIEWFNFPAAQPLGEALNAGAIDVGGLGDAPLIFAYAAGAKIRAVSATRSTPLDLAIVVPAGSPIRGAADLKGKRIATTRGSIGHYLAVATLERANLKLGDVTWSFMQPADARAALASGSVDAWSTWDPYVALSEARDHTRSVANGVGVSSGLSFEAATETAIRASMPNSPISCAASRRASAGRSRIPTRSRRSSRRSRACPPTCSRRSTSARSCTRYRSTTA